MLAGVTAWAAGSLWAIGALVFGAGLRCAGVWFRSPAVMGRGITWALAIAAGWTVFAAAYLRPGAVVGPALPMMSVWQARGAAAYLNIAGRQRMVGPLLTGLGVAGMVIVNTAALTVAIANGGIGEASTRVAYFNFISAALLVLGMHLLIFADGYKLPFSILYIDHFKAINDTRGRHTGDEVLKTIGTILRDHTRQADYVFRWGGDEFVVLLSAAEPEARLKAEQIRQAFLASAIVGHLPDGVDLSIGCVPVPPETPDFDPLIDQADREMYRRKRALAS